MRVYSFYEIENIMVDRAQRNQNVDNIAYFQMGCLGYMKINRVAQTWTTCSDNGEIYKCHQGIWSMAYHLISISVWKSQALLKFSKIGIADHKQSTHF